MIGIIRLIGLLGLITGVCHASSPFMPSDQLLKAYAQALAQEDYIHAREAILSLKTSSNSTPWSKDWSDLLEASILMFEQTDYGDTLGLGAYSQLLERCRISFEQHLVQSESAKDSAAALFALGTLEGFEATRLDQLGRSLNALKPALRSNRSLRQSYELDSSLVDAALGFSLYDYWTSRILRPLHWTPLTRDKRPESIKRIRIVSQQGAYARYLAGAYLAWILVEEEELESAAAVADSHLAALGDTRSFLEPCAKAYFLMGEWATARDRYERFLASIRSAPRWNKVREIGALHRLAMIAFAQEDWKSVISYADEAFSLDLNDVEKEKKMSDLNRLEQFRKRAIERLK